jgi:hypothetical protein
MIRKIACSLVAGALVSTAVLAPTSASARGIHGGVHSFYGSLGLGRSYGIGKGFCGRPYAYVCQ